MLVSTENVMLYVLMKKAELFFNEIISQAHKAWRQLLWSFRIRNSLDGGSDANILLPGANCTIKAICAVPVFLKHPFV